MELTGSIVVITGGGRGLGRAIAEVVASRGAHAIIGGRNIAELRRVCGAIRNSGGVCDFAVVDVGSRSRIDLFLKKIIAAHKKIDVLINNAGWVDKPQSVEKITDRAYKQYVDVNVNSVFYAARIVISHMRKRHAGMMITISSTAGKRANSLVPIYSATKFAARGLAQAIDKSLEGTGVRSITICPGGMNTAMRAKLFGNQEAATQQKPEDVARIIADIITGAITVPVGGDVEIRGGVAEVLS